MAAKKKPVEELDLSALGIDSSSVGKNGARQETVQVTDAEERQAGEIIEDDGDAHEKIIEFLGELKVI
jgi:electron transfer flavoprotein beta subunit